MTMTIVGQDWQDRGEDCRRAPGSEHNRCSVFEVLDRHADIHLVARTDRKRLSKGIAITWSESEANEWHQKHFSPE